MAESYELLIKLDKGVGFNKRSAPGEVERDYISKLYNEKIKKLENAAEGIKTSQEIIIDKDSNETKGNSLSKKIKKGVTYGVTGFTIANNLTTLSLSGNAEMRGDSLYAQRVKSISGNINTSVGLGISAVAVGMSTNLAMGTATLALQFGIKAFQFSQTLKKHIDQLSTEKYINQLNSETLAKNLLGERK